MSKQLTKQERSNQHGQRYSNQAEAGRRRRRGHDIVGLAGVDTGATTTECAATAATSDVMVGCCSGRWRATGGRGDDAGRGIGASD